MIAQQIANELGVKLTQVEKTITLLDDGNTVPFISRYRKEVTGGLDDTQLRDLEERLGYLRELVERKQAVLKSIESQGKLTDELRKQIEDADSKTRVEDLYKPYKPKRRTLAQKAIEAGLLPLADKIYNELDIIPEDAATEFINKDKGIEDSKQALEGARHILMERIANEADLVGKLRELLWDKANITAKVNSEKEKEGLRFKDYFDFSESIKKIPSHRALAVLRGRNEGVLQLSLGHEEPCEEIIKEHLGLVLSDSKRDEWLKAVVKWAWQVKLKLQLEIDLFARMREIAEEKAIDVFAGNLKDLLMAAPAGLKATIGLDPGLRTGVKVAVLDNTGQLLAHTTIYPHAPKNQWNESIEELAHLCEKYNTELISIGNGTASRETEKLVDDLIKLKKDLKLTKVIVSEAGASVYSASKLAAEEFKDLDVTIRGAVSIARRLQDPLAELVKIEPKSIGVGQYQHDVSQLKLTKSLDAVIEDCVNKVGVDLNTASSALLARVAGLNKTIADNIVEFRNKHGIFKNRENLKEVTRLGPKAFTQSAGFLRIRDGENVLDGSGVHPESYAIVTNIAAEQSMDVKDLMQNTKALKAVNAEDFVTDTAGLPTVIDIVKELEKPGRDPRPEFKTVKYNENVTTINDLKPDMILEGIITNVANFGAFVDVGVHQDGLVHISAITNKFISDPREVVKAGDIVQVKVVEVDIPRKRISLSMRMDAKAEHTPRTQRFEKTSKPRQHTPHIKSNNKHKKPKAAPNSMFASALKGALTKQEENV